MRFGKAAVVVLVAVLGGFVVLDAVNRGESYAAVLLVVSAAMVALLPWATTPDSARRDEQLDALMKDVAAIRTSLKVGSSGRGRAWVGIPVVIITLALGAIVCKTVNRRKR